MELPIVVNIIAEYTVVVYSTYAADTEVENVWLYIGSARFSYQNYCSHLASGLDHRCALDETAGKYLVNTKVFITVFFWNKIIYSFMHLFIIHLFKYAERLEIGVERTSL